MASCDIIVDGVTYDKITDYTSLFENSITRARPIEITAVMHAGYIFTNWETGDGRALSGFIDTMKGESETSLTIHVTIMDDFVLYLNFEKEEDNQENNYLEIQNMIIKTPNPGYFIKEEDKSKLSVKQIWILFAICSVLLIAASIFVTIVTKKVISADEGFDIGETFGGSLFLGVATSLPEVTATITLCKKKNFDAAYGDIFGSCVFNIIILAIADALSFNSITHIYSIDSSSFMLIIGTAFVLILSLISIIFIRSKKFKNNAKSRIILYVISILLIASYIAYLAINSAGITFSI